MQNWKMIGDLMSASSLTIDLSKCRTCNEGIGEIPIFHNPILPNVPEDIFNFSGVTVYEMDNFPQNMCQSCLNLLNKCILFRNMCQKTNKEFMELIIKKEPNYMEGIKQEVCDPFKPDNCDNDCDAPFPQSESPDVHKCPTCSREFTNFKVYSKHLKRCKKPRQRRKKNKDQVKGPKKPRIRRKYECKESCLCDTCGNVFGSYHGLMGHLSTHENIFPYKCDQCPYRGRTPDLLKVHQRSHLTDKPFKCTQCPRATTTASNLARHMAYVHSKVKPFKCSFCGREFANQSTMKFHVKNCHLVTPLECNICYNKYQTKRSLRGHLIRVHKQKKHTHSRPPSYLMVQDSNGAPTGSGEEGHTEVALEDNSPSKEISSNASCKKTQAEK